jgi:hypothetical protein
MQVSSYDDIAQVFLTDHPVGTALTSERLLAWVEQHANGHILRSDLSIPDPHKKLTALRRHLNQGARTQNVAEDRRFIIMSVDPKRGALSIMSLAEHAHRQATQAWVRSAGAAIAPINSALRRLEDIKVDELPDELHREIVKDRENLEADKEPIRQVYLEQADRRMVTALIDRGNTEQQARALLASMHTIAPYQKLLQKLS